MDTLSNLKASIPVEIPIYDFRKHQRSDVTKKMNPGDVVILEGILIFHDSRLRDQMNMKIFVDTDADVRLARRIRRDTVERGRDVQVQCKSFLEFLKKDAAARD